MEGLNSAISTVMLNVNDLNTPTKSQGLSDWIKKARPNCTLSKIYVITLNIKTQEG